MPPELKPNGRRFLTWLEAWPTVAAWRASAEEQDRAPLGTVDMFEHQIRISVLSCSNESTISTAPDIKTVYGIGVNAPPRCLLTVAHLLVS
jgi:hypothetical protein